MERIIFKGKLLMIESLDIIEEWKKFTKVHNNLIQGKLNYLDIEYDLDGTIKRYIINVFILCDSKIKEYTASYSGHHHEYQLYSQDAYIEENSFLKKSYFFEEIELVSKAIKRVFLFPEGQYLNYHIYYDGYVKCGIKRDKYYLVQDEKIELFSKTELPIEGYGFKVYGMLKTGKRTAASDIATWFMF